MSTLLTAIGLVCVIEGLIYALATQRVKQLMRVMQQMPDEQLRFAGLVIASLGVLLVWLVRVVLG